MNGINQLNRIRFPWESEDYCGRPNGCGRGKKVDKKVDKKVTPIVKEQAKTLSF